MVIKLVYRPRVTGLEYLAALEGGPGLLVANHTSHLDAVLLVAFISRRLTFAVDFKWTRAWWRQPLLRLFRVLSLNPDQSLTTRGLVEVLERGELVVIFPECRLTITGGLTKVYDGSGLIAAKSEVPILLIIIDGPQFTRFGRLRDLLRYCPRYPKISLTVLPPPVV
ncbi:MAG: hypothetical protein AMR96_06415 [Candidatus Adiutrix intracellularis]|nr:MAG: hypothetical protein AMR96_06415 [Candidatus Adiutrix intracellularis]